MKKARKAKQPKQPRHADLFEFGEFANNATVRFGITEATIQFSRTRPTGTGEWPAEEVARLTVPLSVAKVLVYNFLSYILPLEAMLGGPILVTGAQVPELHVNQVLPPDVIARLVALHGELFPAPPAAPEFTTPQPQTDSAVEDKDQGQKPKITMH